MGRLSFDQAIELVRSFLGELDDEVTAVVAAEVDLNRGARTNVAVVGLEIDFVVRTFFVSGVGAFVDDAIRGFRGTDGDAELVAEGIFAIGVSEVDLATIATTEAGASGSGVRTGFRGIVDAVTNLFVAVANLAGNGGGFSAERVDGFTDSFTDGTEYGAEESGVTVIGRATDLVTIDLIAAVIVADFVGIDDAVGGEVLFAAAADRSVDGVIVEHFGEELVAVALVTSGAAPRLREGPIVTHTFVAVNDVRDNDVGFGEFRGFGLELVSGHVSEIGALFTIEFTVAVDDEVDDLVVVIRSRNEVIDRR